MAKPRRITAETPATVVDKNSLTYLLLQRELGARCQHAIQKQLGQALLQVCRLQAVFDTHDANTATASMALAYMRRRSAVLEMAVCDPLLFVLLHSGLCVVFNTTGTVISKKVSYLNAGSHDVIRSILYNPCTTSILVISCHSDDSFVRLHCRAVPANPRLFADHGNYCTAGQSVLEAVAHPGFIEFHDSPCRALVLDAANGQYKVYDLSKPSYRVLYCLSADGITDIKLSRSYILLVKELQRKQWCRRHGQDATIALTVKPAGEFKQPESPEHDSWQQERNQQHQQQQLSQPQPKEDSSVCSSSLSINHICGRQSRRPPRQSVAPLEVLSAADGQVLVRHELPVELCHSGFQVLELFDEHLLIKQALQPIMIHNVLSLSLLGSNAHELLSQLSSFMHLQGHNMFLTVTGQILATWTFKAQMVARFAEHELWYPVDNQVDQLVCLSGDWLISYCKPRSSRAHLPAAGAAGAIAVSSVVTGKPLARIEAPDSGDPDVEGASVLGQAANNKTSCDTLLDTSHDKATRAALTDVTAVLYDEHMRVIYTGNRGGLVHKWSAG